MAQASADVVGRKVVNLRGERIGRSTRTLTQGDNDEPDWLMMRIGWLGLKKKIVPLEHISEKDGKLELLHELDWVRGAPDVRHDGKCISEEQADILRQHFGLERHVSAAEADPEETNLSREPRDAEMPGLDEKPDDPIVKRRHERAQELEIPTSPPGASGEAGETLVAGADTQAGGAEGGNGAARGEEADSSPAGGGAA